MFSIPFFMALLILDAILDFDLAKSTKEYCKLVTSAKEQDHNDYLHISSSS